jgi:hypothetical protein
VVEVVGEEMGSEKCKAEESSGRVEGVGGCWVVEGVGMM